MDLKSVIRTVPDFPKAGITFIDLTTLMLDSEAYQETIARLCQPYRGQSIDGVVGIESRGFIFGAAMAYELDCAFIPIRKPGKLPAETIQESYELEYGTDTVEIHKDAIGSHDKIVLADDLLATGGTAAAAVRLIRKIKGEIVGCSFVVELDFLNGRNLLPDLNVHTLIHYDSE